MNRQGIYIYGFVPSHCFEAIKSLLLESGIYAIEYGDVSAVVSDTRNEKLEYLDREALAHPLLIISKKLKEL